MGRQGLIPTPRHPRQVRVLHGERRVTTSLIGPIDPCPTNIDHCVVADHDRGPDAHDNDHVDPAVASGLAGLPPWLSTGIEPTNARPMRRPSVVGAFGIAIVILLAIAPGAVAAQGRRAQAATSSDPDHDGLSTTWEQRLGLDPHRADTDGDGIRDGAEDPDRDRLSNRFEIARSDTDPRRGDTDRDGIRDGAEDPDGDGLANAGEERYSTSPTRRDTDRDGKDDWHEDADHDKRTNGTEQDAGRVPVSLLHDWYDLVHERPVSYGDGCHKVGAQTDATPCVYGDAGGAKTVLLIGDSHAAQWLPALLVLANKHHWRLLSLTKSGCPAPSTTVLKSEDRPDVSCNTWREAAFEAVESAHPDLVLVASRMDYHLDGSWLIKNDTNRAIWRAGMVTSLERLRAGAGAGAGKVVLLGDTPQWAQPVARCLKDHPEDISLCSNPRRNAVDTVRLANDASAAEEADVLYRRTTSLVCHYEPCPTIIDRWLISSDDDHLTPMYSRLIAPGLDRLLPSFGN